MKRIFLHAFLGISFLAQAQYEPENYMSANWAMEDMSNPFGAPSFGQNKKGVYFWRPKDEWYFKTTMSRISDADALNGIGYVSFISTHTSGSYHPVGIGFGEDAYAKPYFIDMSASKNDTVFIEVENMSDQHLNIRVGLKDVNNNLIDTKAGTSLTNISSGIIDLDLPAKSTRTKKFVYQGGFYAEWGNKDKCTDWANPNAKSTPCAIKKFDFTKVVGANITINSNNPQNVGVDNAEVRIRKIQFGNSPFILTSNQGNEYFSNETLTVSPSPSKGNLVSLNRIIQNGTVYDSKGNLVLNLLNTSKIDVTNFQSGIYILATTGGNFRFVVE